MWVRLWLWDEGGDAIWRKRERRCATKHQDPVSMAVPELLVGNANQHRNHRFLGFESVENVMVDHGQTRSVTTSFSIS
jgi:hypothetical protein